MSDPDHDSYRRSPEPPLTMDRSRRARARGPAPITLIVSVLLLAAVVGGVVYMYRSGARGRADAPQPLGAPLGDVRAPPPPQTENRDATAGLTIARDDPGAQPATNPTLAPPPEQPMPDAPPPPRQQAAPSQAASPGGAAPGALASQPSPPSAPTDAPKPKHVINPHAADGPDPIDSLIAKADKPKPAPARPADTPVLIQIGAFSSEALADKEWSKVASIAPGPMAGKGKRVVPINKDGATLYRTSITGFASRDQAQGVCDRLVAAGGKCFVR